MEVPEQTINKLHNQIRQQ